MELIVKLHVVPREGTDGKLPDSASEVLDLVNSARLGMPTWYLGEVEQLGQLTHHVYASDGISSADEIA